MTVNSSPSATPAMALSVRDLRVTLGTGTVDIVDEISLELRPGEIVGLVGESGCGKTTVGMAVLGHCRSGTHMRGEIIIGQQNIGDLSVAGLSAIRGGVVAYIPQDPPTALNPSLRIAVQLDEMLEDYASSWTSTQRRVRVREVLDEVSLPSDDGFLRRYPHQLSGGQQQRLVIAMAVICHPQVIVCDEPTTGLDVTTQARILALIRQLCRAHGIAVLYISHDLAVVASLVDRVAVMYAGRVVEQANRAELFDKPHHPYTVGLLAAVPDLNGRRQMIGIPGHAPSPRYRPTGCSFRDRCLAASEKCAERFPPTTTHGPDHVVRCFHPLAGLSLTSQSAARPNLREREPALELRGLTAAYGNTVVLSGIDLTLHRQECLALVGESGSGKTTLARAVMGLVPEVGGSVSLLGQKLTTSTRRRTQEQRRLLQYVFQSPFASLNPRHTIGEIIATPLRLFHGLRGSSANERVAGLLQRVSLPASASGMFPDQLSGGERQRVAIARALAAEPNVLVCDEITSALDVSVQATIIELLAKLQAEMGLSVLFITHNLALIRTIADRVAVMHNGSLVETGSVQTIFETAADKYTRQLIADTPSFSSGQ